MTWQQELQRIDAEIAAKEESLQSFQPSLDAAIANHTSLEEQLKEANLRQRYFDGLFFFGIKTRV